MGAAFLGEDVVAEAQNVLFKGVHELEGRLYLDIFNGSFKIYRLMDRFFPAVQLPYIGHDAVGLRKYQAFLLAWAAVFIADRQTGI